MSQSASLSSDYQLPARPNPLILDTLPDIPNVDGCSPRIHQRIDLLLLAIEALELGGSEYMLATAKDLELHSIIDNRVTLWRLRCTNPWRRSYTRGGLTIPQAKALVIIISDRARRLTLLIRQLLTAYNDTQAKGLPIEQHFRLSEYIERFRTHFRSRMNPRRAKVALYLEQEDLLNQLAIALLTQLLFCTGVSGVQRLWISLFDGEVL